MLGTEATYDSVPVPLDPEELPTPFEIDTSRPLGDLLHDATTNIEEQYIRKALEQSHGNVGRCAKICGLSRRSISAKIAEYNINKAHFKEN